LYKIRVAYEGRVGPMRHIRILVSILIVSTLIACSKPVVKIFNPEALPPDKKWIDIDGVPMVYKDQGEGLPLVIFSSFPLSIDSWDGFIQFLVPYFRVIVVEPPWLVEPSSLDGDFSTEHMLQLYRKFVRRLGLGKVHALGIGEGGAIAISFGHHFPEHILTAISINGFEGVSWSIKGGAITARDLIDRFYNPSRKGIIKLLQDGSIRYRQDSSFRDRITPTLHIGDNETLVDAIHKRKIAWTQDIKSLFVLAMIEYIHFPVLMIRSEYEPFVAEEYVNWARKRMKGEEFYILNGAGHFAIFDKPRKVAETVRDFIDRHPVRRPEELIF